MVSKQNNLDPYNRIDDRLLIIKSLSYEIIHRMTEKVIVTPTYIVATILLMHRKGISEKLLIERVEWLSEELILRGAKIGTYNDTSNGSAAVKSALNLMDNIITRNKKNVFQMSLSA